MGNYCKDVIKETGFQADTENTNFIRTSWTLLKKNHQLSFISPQDEGQMIAQLSAIPHQNLVIKTLQSGSNNKSIIVKQGVYLYVGEVLRQRMYGLGAVALPNQRLFIGNFKNGWIQGAGEFRMLTNSSSNAKPVRLKGEWGEKVQGTISIGNGYSAFPFSATKLMIFEMDNCKYIQYPNYDEYVGETLQGLAHGQGKYVYRNGDKQRQFPIYEGYFRQGKRDGRGIMRYSASMQLRINWKEGKPNGYGCLIIDNIRNSILYKQGKRMEKIVSEVDDTT